ncbi:putative sugar phosphate isomerase/epimerase [Methanobrevibacter arboriphilus JCM 13429 = DSM 1125]|uniref:Putative sugar phosphate isomerase/epimerase n=1 Tax=Methanobrevibacter arboriphilus JCM 13429 = DSM 1125 TaxID=1300164 RepID=A0A1V6N1L2_METAZ|nr:sugar phosphate isomerase/epimerase [Methanobrevibacter arboriphilus]OQD58545.1 putative sugar phosphate isomerase/epimerase [Methanobrevibacter arboriphilus JCM 13429 = DSM 1125]
MKLGFSSLSLFMKSLEEILDIATNDKFDLLEILCEGPYWPRNLLNSQNHINLEVFDSYDIELMLHSPTIDLNPASMNEGIRNETAKQTKEALDLAAKIGALAITTHPGVVHRKEERIRNLAIRFCIETLKDCQKYAEDVGVILSVENMPNKQEYLANSPEEHRKLVESVGSSATIDWGHANTYKSPYEYLKIPNISYFHLNDNEGEKDSHIPLGKGSADFSKNFLNQVKKGIIELNNYEDVLKSKQYILKELNTD